MHDPNLLDRLETLPWSPWKGLVYRYTLGDYPPDRANYKGARWNPRDTAAIYSSLEKKTVLAEAQYRLSIEPFPVRLALWLHTVRVEVDSAVDLRDAELLRELGISEAELQDDDYSPCQRVGGAVAWLGRAGLFVPSARAGGGAGNLVLFPEAGERFEFEVVERKSVSHDGT